MNDNKKLMVFGADIMKIESTEKQVRGKDYISWGDGYLRSGDNVVDGELKLKNNFPSVINYFYDNCSDHQTIVDGICQYIYGEGIYTENIELQPFMDKCNNDGETLNEIFDKCVNDFYKFGGYSLQVIYNKGKNINEIYHIDIDKVRTNLDITNAYISNDWSKYNPDYEIIPMWDNKINNESVIYYYKSPKSKGVYPVPFYNASYNPLLTSIKINDYHLNNISNGFAPNTLINLNGLSELSDSEKQQIQDDIVLNFSGVNGKKFIIMFNQSGVEPSTIDRLDDESQDQKFEVLRKDTRDSIYTSHRITSPSLFGVTQEGQGFSKTEYTESFEIFNQTIIKNYQNLMVNSFNKLLHQSWPNANVKIKPFAINKTTENGTI